MLFNSYVFILGFLPLTAAGFFLLSRIDHRAAGGWLLLASLFFYGWWNAHYLPLLLLSILFNYSAGLAISRFRGPKPAKAHAILILAIGANLFCLGYYKYTGFLLNSAATMTGLHITILRVMLPIGISFFTFTQIAFLADAYAGKVREYSFANYALFVSYFPHLIAGPILHHSEMMPQFARRKTYRFRAENILSGLTYFLIGLAKKVVFADGVASFVGPVFDSHAALSTPQAWAGALSYTMQIYFDFSAYSDMAIGLSRIFNVELPLNFDSPYKAANIVEFWRRWHMTLSRFLRDYLYIPLGGNRHGPARRYLNLGLTMLLGGLWHGAGWTFVIWGGLHGLYLGINHAWRSFGGGVASKYLLLPGWSLTFLAVVIAWVFFRAPDLATAMRVLSAMAGHGQSGPVLATDVSPGLLPFLADQAWPWIIGLGLIALLLPNSQEIMAWLAARRLPDRLAYNMLLSSAFATMVCGLILFTVSIQSMRNAVSPFIYFNF